MGVIMKPFFVRTAALMILGCLSLSNFAPAQETFVAVENARVAECFTKTGLRDWAGDRLPIRSLRPDYVAARVPTDETEITAEQLEYARLNRQALALRSARLFVFDSRDQSLESRFWRERFASQGVKLVAVVCDEQGRCCSSSLQRPKSNSALHAQDLVSIVLKDLSKNRESWRTGAIP